MSVAEKWHPPQEYEGYVPYYEQGYGYSSQPGSPRPAPASPKYESAPYNGPSEDYYPPYPPIRKRRSDAFFTVEAGPFFSATKQHFNLYSLDRSATYEVKINSKVDRGFFLADNDWTCYRRNYFQVSAAFTILGMNLAYDNMMDTPCLVELDNGVAQVQQFLIGISARVSNSDKKIDLIQHTPKRDKGPQSTPEPRPLRAGGNLNLTAVGASQNVITFERVQFKTATANNGKRRAAQQYYVIMVDLWVQTDSGEQVKIASCQSAPLVVRGRSPGHYADNGSSSERYNPMGTQSEGGADGRYPHFSGPRSAPSTPNGAVDYPYPSYPHYSGYAQFSPVPGAPIRPGDQPPPHGYPPPPHSQALPPPPQTSDAHPPTGYKNEEVTRSEAGEAYYGNGEYISPDPAHKHMPQGPPTHREDPWHARMRQDSQASMMSNSSGTGDEAPIYTPYGHPPAHHAPPPHHPHHPHHPPPPPHHHYSGMNGNGQDPHDDYHYHHHHHPHDYVYDPRASQPPMGYRHDYPPEYYHKHDYPGHEHDYDHGQETQAQESVEHVHPGEGKHDAGRSPTPQEPSASHAAASAPLAKSDA